MSITDALFSAANDNFRKCDRCGDALPEPKGNGGGRARKFCSDTCRNASNYTPALAVDNTCRWCAESFAGRRGKIFCGTECRRKDEYSKRDLEKELARRKETAPERQCEHCGITFRRSKGLKSAARFCSRKCGFDAGANLEGMDNGLITKALKYGDGIKPASFSVYRPLCGCCGVRFTAQSTASRLCSEECKVKDAKVKYYERAVANDNVDRTPRPCAECDKIFSPAYGEKSRVFCSKQCGAKHGRRIVKAARKLRQKVAHVENVDPFKVFERDGWRCQICRVKTPRNLRGTYDDRAPELDHIMPLSLGGAHSYMNTQCACRKCNSIKSNTPPDQVSLFAYAA